MLFIGACAERKTSWNLDLNSENPLPAYAFLKTNVIVYGHLLIKQKRLSGRASLSRNGLLQMAVSFCAGDY